MGSISVFFRCVYLCITRTNVDIIWKWWPSWPDQWCWPHFFPFHCLFWGRVIIEMLCKFVKLTKSFESNETNLESWICWACNFLIVFQLIASLFNTDIHRLPAWGCRLLLRALGVTYEVRGLENIQPNHGAVVVINHQSAIDLTGKHKSICKLILIVLLFLVFLLLVLCTAVHIYTLTKSALIHGFSQYFYNICFVCLQFFDDC